MKKIIVIIMSVLFFHAGFSQDKTKSILDKTSAKVKAYETIVADFDFTMENKVEDIREDYKGKIFLKGDKYFLDLMDVATIYDGKTLYSYLRDVKEVNISEPEDEDEDFLNPAKLFTIYEEGFIPKLVEETTINNKKVYSIDLFPTNDDKEYNKINIKIDKSTYHIVSLQSYGKEGNNIIVKVRSMKTNELVNDSKFSFNTVAYPDVEIIDMR